jgi:sterol desaturase/sphingolipid hydroxylase (fatty acid hydroxylase superfamily)
MQMIANAFYAVHQWLFEAFVQPVAFALGLANVLEDAYIGTEWFLIGLVDIALLLILIRPLEKWRPVEAVIDKKAVWTDVIYTLVHRLALFRLALFFTIDPLMDIFKTQLHSVGVQPLQLETLWPGFTDIALVSFVIYLVALDFVEYWLHRAQHEFNWWWSLHSLHHSQRQMTMWSDNRNHLLDDVIIDVCMVLVATAIGVSPAQFILLIAASRVAQSFQHANVRLSFNGFAGGFFERIIVSPRFHRLHHTIGIGHESPVPARNATSAAGPSQGARAPTGGSAANEVASVGAVTLGGHNFGVLFAWWDVIFGTANFEERYDATGVRDQLPEEGARDYGNGFWAQQWLGLKRLFRVA